MINVKDIATDFEKTCTGLLVDRIMKDIDKTYQDIKKICLETWHRIPWSTIESKHNAIYWNYEYIYYDNAGNIISSYIIEESLLHKTLL